LYYLFSSVVNIKLEEVAMAMHCNLRPPDVMQVILGMSDFRKNTYGRLRKNLQKSLTYKKTYDEHAIYKES